MGTLKSPHHEVPTSFVVKVIHKRNVNGRAYDSSSNRHCFRSNLRCDRDAKSGGNYGYSAG